MNKPISIKNNKIIIKGDKIIIRISKSVLVLDKNTVDSIDTLNINNVLFKKVKYE